MRRTNSGLIIARELPRGRSGIVSPWDIAQAESNYSFPTDSVRLRSGASFFRTPSVTGNSQKFTLSWFGKLATGGSNLFVGGNYGETYAGFKIWGFSGGQLTIGSGTYGISTDYSYSSSELSLEYSRFHHFHIAVDTTQAVASNRFMFFYDNQRIYLNGYPGLNEGLYANAIQLNRFFGGEQIISEAHMVAGQQLMPSAFQTADGRNLPIKYTGTYGTNGWHMEFKDKSAVTSGSNVGIGKDTSGNGYYLNTTGISVTAGATYDAFTDVPINSSASSSDFATLDRDNPSASTLTNCNLTASGTTDLPTIRPTKGNWYFEIGGVSKTWTPPAAFPAAAGDYNFGQRPLTNSIPAGHALLNQFNVKLLGA